MQDLFYIVEVRPQWYNLILKDTHFCIGCGGDIDTLLKTIHKYVRKYKVESRVYQAINNSECGGSVPPKVFERRQEVFNSGAHLVFEDLIRGVVSQALKENRQDTPYHHAKKKVRSITPFIKAAASDTPTQDQRTVGRIRPRKIQRTTTE